MAKLLWFLSSATCRGGRSSEKLRVERPTRRGMEGCIATALIMRLVALPLMVTYVPAIPMWPVELFYR